MERDLSDVMSVASSSVKIHTLKNIGEYIQRNLSNVSSVENPLFRSQHSLNIRKSIHERNSCECGIWQKSSKFKVQNSHPTVAQRIHPTEKPYKYHECGNILGFMRKFILDRSQIYMYLLVRSLEHEFILERFLTNFTNFFFSFFLKKGTLSSHLTSSIRLFILEKTHSNVMCVARILPQSHKIGTQWSHTSQTQWLWQILYLFHSMYSLMTLVQVLSNCSKSIFEEKLQRSFRVKETRILPQQR